MYIKALFDTTPTLDIADVLTTVGISVKIGTTQILWAHDLGALGGEPEGIDCTPLISKVHLEKAGVEQMEKWKIDYYFNDDDYSALETLKAATTSSTIEVKTDSGAKWTNTGKVASNYVGDVAVNGMLDCHATVELSGEWTYTPAQ